MKKKIILGLATFLMAAGAYWLLSSGDRRVAPLPEGDTTETVNRFVSRPTTQSRQTIGQEGLTFSPGEQTRVRVYDDVTGRLKYIFEAQSWEPTSDSNLDYHLNDLDIQIYMPRGEITYITADEADITLERRGGSRLDPKRGVLHGKVHVVIDRTTSEWRERNADLAERAAHPDYLINIDLAEARFDLDRAELVAEGDVVVDSSEARIENVRGLKIQWDQLDNRIDYLRFAEGGRMTLRRGGRIVDFGLPGATRAVRSDEKKPADQSSADPVASADGPRVVPMAGGSIHVYRTDASTAGDGEDAERIPIAQAMKPMSIETVTAAEAAAEIRMEGGVIAANQPRSLSTAHPPVAKGDEPPDGLRDSSALARDMDQLRKEVRAGAEGIPDVRTVIVAEDDSGRRKVHTYRAVFENNVVVQQIEGLKIRGQLEADRLEINFGIGRGRRDLLGEEKPSVRPQKAAAIVPPQQPKPAEDVADAIVTPGISENDETKLILTWNGPLELRPLNVEHDPEASERFDVVATGNPVHVRDERGTAVCDQLVYRHQRRQVWLAGRTQRLDAASGAERQVELAVSASQRLFGQEIFFDAKRGLGRVDGAGAIIDERRDEPGAAAGSALLPNVSGVSVSVGTSRIDNTRPGRARDPVIIRWARGVDLELGWHDVTVLDPATGQYVPKRKEFLRRAWFHGDVSMKQGDESLVGDEVAVTFRPPPTAADDAGPIEHLNMTGAVRMTRGDDVLAGNRLDIAMTVTPEGDNVPQAVDAVGGGLAKQGRREIRADQIHARMAHLFQPSPTGPDGRPTGRGRTEVGIERVDASGNVFVRDPDQNLKISRAESLKARMRNGNELVTATILSGNSKRYARARHGEVALHGHRIDINMDRQSIQVPGPGVSYMQTTEDFGGQKLNEPTVVRTTWRDKMDFQVGRNYGVFVGQVRSSTDTFDLRCDKLTVRFSKAPPAPPEPAGGGGSPAADFGAVIGESTVVGMFVSPPTRAVYSQIRMLSGLPSGRVFAFLTRMIDREKSDEPAETRYALPTGEQKRPAYVVADGHAEAVRREFSPVGLFGRKGRLLTRLRIAARQIAVDLKAEQMSVPCPGSLLIEDYQFDPRAMESATLASGAPRSPLMSSLRSEGPSQTLVTWENSMDYFVDRSLVVYDKNVSMVHRSGRKMVRLAELAAAMQVDPAQLRYLGEGRIANLSCGNLLLEFRRRSDKKAAGDGVIRATDLERLIARQAIEFKENTKSLTGEHLQYLHATNEIRLEGGTNFDAMIVDQEEGDQRFIMWRGPVLVWDRNQDRIEAPGATIRTSRR